RVRPFEDGLGHAVAAAGDDAGHQGLLCGQPVPPRAHRPAGAGGRQGLGAPDRRGGGNSMSAMQHLLAVGGDAAAFFRMGGYAAYVWPAYAVFFAVLVADTLAPRLRGRLTRQAARERRATSVSRSP